MSRRVIVHDARGQKTAVIRPWTTGGRELALHLAARAVATNDGEAFAALPAQVGDYKFLGFLGRTRHVVPPPPTRAPYCVVDQDGQFLGPVEPGDSFVGYDGLRENATVVGSA